MYLGTRGEHLEECLPIVRSETDELAAGDLRPGELERAKRHLKGRLLLAMESTSARMSRLGKSLISGVEILSRRDLRTDRRGHAGRDGVAGRGSEAPGTSRRPASGPTRRASTTPSPRPPTLQPAA